MKTETMFRQATAGVAAAGAANAAPLGSRTVSGRQRPGQTTRPARGRQLGWVAILALGFSMLGWTQTASHRPKRPHNPNAIEALTIVIRPEGFRPGAVRVPFGHYELGIYNRSGLHNLPLEFERMPGNALDGPAAERVANGVAEKRTARWIKHVVLTPGTYRLRVTNRARWACRIDVQ